MGWPNPLGFRKPSEALYYAACPIAILLYFQLICHSGSGLSLFEAGVWQY